MRLAALPLLLTSLALAACQQIAQERADAQRPRASVTGSHVETDPTRVDTFRVTEVDGRPIGRGEEPGKTLRVDATTQIVAGRPVHVAFEGLAFYPNSARRLFWDDYAVHGSADFVPEAQARYVVRGSIAPTGSTVWLENEATHDIVGRKFTATPKKSDAPPAESMGSKL